MSLPQVFAGPLDRSAVYLRPHGGSGAAARPSTEPVRSRSDPLPLDPPVWSQVPSLELVTAWVAAVTSAATTTQARLASGLATYQDNQADGLDGDVPADGPLAAAREL